VSSETVARRKNVSKEAENIVGYVTRQRLVKTQQTEKTYSTCCWSNELAVRQSPASKDVNAKLRDLRHWKPLPGNNWRRHSRLGIHSTCCCELQSVWISDSMIVTCSYVVYLFNKSNYQSKPRLQSLYHVTICPIRKHSRKFALRTVMFYENVDHLILDLLIFFLVTASLALCTHQALGPHRGGYGD
jgi:hypothetical protein